MLNGFIPQSFVERLNDSAPLRLSLDGVAIPLSLQTVDGTTWEDQHGTLRVAIQARYEERYRALSWATILYNQGQQPIEHLVCIPLYRELDIEPERGTPRVRHLSGSYPYDGAYPPRAFRLSEERFLTHDHCKPVRITGGYHRSGREHMVAIAGSAGEHVPVMQFSVGPLGNMSGLFVGFEWSSRWHIEAGWMRNSFQGEEHPPFVIQGNTGFSEICLEPGEVLTLPTVHMGFVEGKEWVALLLYPFRMEGPSSACVKIPRGAWKQRLGAEAATITVSEGGI